MSSASALAYRNRAVTRRIILHESHTKPCLDTAAKLRAAGRAMGLLDVGYHYVIERDGQIHFTRHFATLGSHAPGANHDSVGICLALADGEEPKHRQLQSLAWVIADLEERHGNSLPLIGHDEAIKYHRLDGKPRCSCCNAERMETIRDVMNQYTDSRSRPGAKEGGCDDRALYQSNGGSGGGNSPPKPPAGGQAGQSPAPPSQPQQPQAPKAPPRGGTGG